MKKHYFVLCLIFLFSTVAVSAADLSNIKVCIDPGHGSYGPNDRPMATIPYPMLSSTGRPEIGVGFYESNTNLWKAEKLDEMLRAAGATVYMTHTVCGGTEEENPPYNPSLSARAAMAQSNNVDYFISIHSNASKEETDNEYLVNYLALYTSSWSSLTTTQKNKNTDLARKAWPFAFEAMGEGLEIKSHYTYDNTNLITFNYAVLRHSRPAMLVEGWFHTYQPARHRALNKDFCRQEGVRYYRAIADYFKVTGSEVDSKGYIMGVVKSQDQKMTRSKNLSKTSWFYRTGTHDQYVPLNGATVELLDADGESVTRDGNPVTYTVDNNYNGVFVFEDLEPGTYQVRATCANHKALTRTVTVEANKTQYPIMLLAEGTDITPLSSLGVEWNWNAALTSSPIKGIIRRTLQYEDNIIVLTHDENRTPHIYAINQRKITATDPANATITGAITELSTDGIDLLPDANNKGDYLTISDIALTDDGKLVACNFMRSQYDVAHVDAGFKRGTIRFYKWEALTAKPSLWVSRTGGGYQSGNFYRADVGYTLAVSGSSDNCVLTVTAVEAGQGALRYVHITVADNKITNGIYTKSGLTDPASFLDVDHATNPTDYRLGTSPLGPQRWVIDGTTITASEFLQASNAETNTINGAISPDFFGTKNIETNFACYQGHHLATAPYYTDGNLSAVRVLDITNGFSAATKVTLQNKGAEGNPELVLSTPFAEDEVKYASATSQVDGTDVHVYLFVEYKDADNKRQLRLTKYSTKTAAENALASNYAEKGIYASQLTREDVNGDNKEYRLSFMVNDTPDKTTIHYYKNGIPVYSQEVTGVVAGELKTVNIDTETLLELEDADGDPIFAIGDVIEWAVEVTNNKKVTRWVNTPLDKTIGTTDSKNYHTVEIYPSSPTFGRIYVAHKESNGSANNGVIVYNRKYERHNENVYKGGETTWYRPRRMAIDSKGTMYLPELRDVHSGVFLAKAKQVSGTYTQFFAGTRNGDGVFTNNAGGSTTSAHIYGEGKNTKLLVFNEDYAAGTLNYNTVLLYNIGTSNGNILTQWSNAPTRVYDVGLSKYDIEDDGAINLVEGNVWGTSHGFFVCAALGGDNSASYPTLQFYDYDGNRLYTSAGNTDIRRSLGAAFAVSADEDVLVLDHQRTFLVYTIDWEANTPTLTLRETYTHGDGTMYQMNFDYAGNLIASGEQGLFMYAFPTTDENTRLTPAREDQTLVIPDPNVEEEPTIPVKGAAIYAYDLNVNVSVDYEEYTFTFKVNDNATAAALVFFEEGTQNEIGRVALSPLPEHSKVNTYKLSADQIPSISDAIQQTLSWGVEVTSYPITAEKDWGLLYEVVKTSTTTFNGKTSAFVYSAVDVYPESPYFGNIYALNYEKSASENNGFFVYTLDALDGTPSEAFYQTDGTFYTTTHQPKYAGMAFSVASDGRLFRADYDNTYKGVYVIDPKDFTSTEFFVGNLISNTTVTGVVQVVNSSNTAIGTPTSVAAVYGRGKDRKLLIATRFGGNVLKANRVLRYDIGEAKSWSTAPSFMTTDDLKAVRYASIAPTKEGFWIMREDHTSGSLWFYDWSGERKYASTGTASGAGDISMSSQAALAVSQDGSVLVVYNGDNKLTVFDVTYGSTLTLTKRSEELSLTGVYQMNFDYAGNLVVSGTFGMRIYSFLKEDNTCMTPAKNAFTRMVSTPQAEKPIRGIFAYDLRVTGEYEEPHKITLSEGEKFLVMQPEPSTNSYTFTFKANENATYAELQFFKDEVSDYDLLTAIPEKSFKIDGVVRGENKITIPATELPTSSIEGLKWAVELTADNVTDWGVVYEEKSTGSTVTKGVNVVNTNPQTSAFGRIYTYFYDSDNTKEGAYIYTPLEDSVRNKPQEGRDFTWGKLARMGIDGDGNVFFTDKSTSNPGIFVGTLDDDNRDVMPITKFFQSTKKTTEENNAEKKEENGVVVNDVDDYTYPILKNENDEEIGSAVLGVDVFTLKEGTDAGRNMLLAYMKGHAPLSSTDITAENYYLQYVNQANEGKIPYHSVAMYDLGNNKDRSLKTTWAKEPTRVIPIKSNHHVAHTADVFGTPHGFFAVHYRNSSAVGDETWQNNDWAASLLFYSKGPNPATDDYKETLNSGYEPLKHLINGSHGAGMAIQSDENNIPYRLFLQNGLKQFLVFDVAWEKTQIDSKEYTKPVLTLRHIYHHGINELTQMSFDYGGNLIATGEGGLTVFTIPDPQKPINRHRTPARSRLKVILNDPTYDRVFVGGEATAENRKDWSVPENWEPKLLPVKENRVLIKAPCEVDVTDACAKSIDIMKPTTGDAITLSVLPAQALTVQEKILEIAEAAIPSYTQGTHTPDENRWERLSRTILANTELLTIKASAAGQGILVHQIATESEIVSEDESENGGVETISEGTSETPNESSNTLATVELYGKYTYNEDTKNPDLKWQYMGVPFNLAEPDAVNAFYGTWIYQWDEPTSTWEMLAGRGHSLSAFRGYILTHDVEDQNRTHVMKGNLAASAPRTIDLTKKGPTLTFTGANFIANSWTAPLHIENFTTEDFDNTDATVYIHSYAGEGYDKYIENQYISLPVLHKDNPIKVIDPLQGFFVLTSRGDEYAAKNASLHLEYARLVTPPAKSEELDNATDSEGSGEGEVTPAPARAPRMSPTVNERMIITVTGKDGSSDYIRLYQDEIYTPLFDNGYEGRKMEGDATVPYFTATTTDGEMAVLATPNYYGTMLNFRKGEAQEYTVTFEYDNPDETWMLEDLIAHTSVEIRSGNKYWFTTNDADIRTRFRISRRGEENDGVLLPPSVWVANGQLYLENPTDEPVDVRVYTVDGKLVQHVKTGDLITPLKVPIRGLYIIQITHTNSVQTVKQLL